MSVSDQAIYEKARDILIRLKIKQITNKTSRTNLVKAAKQVIGGEVSGDPVQVLGLLISLYPIVEPRLATSTNTRLYTLDRSMTRAMLRCKNLPVPIGIN